MDKDPLLDEARFLARAMAEHKIYSVEFEDGTEIQQPEKISIPFLQKHLDIDYPRAVRLMEQLEKEGFQVEYIRPKQEPVVSSAIMNNTFINGLKVALLIFLPFPIGADWFFVAISSLVAGKNNYAIIFAVISAALIITAIVAIKLHSKRCKRCGKWNALQVIKVEELEKRKVMIKTILEETHRNSEGEVIETVEKEALAPAIRVYYGVNKKCKFCGHIRRDVKVKTFSD